MNHDNPTIGYNPYRTSTSSASASSKASPQPRGVVSNTRDQSGIGEHNNLHVGAGDFPATLSSDYSVGLPGGSHLGGGVSNGGMPNGALSGGLNANGVSNDNGVLSGNGDVSVSGQTIGAKEPGALPPINQKSSSLMYDDDFSITPRGGQNDDEEFINPMRNSNVDRQRMHQNITAASSTHAVLNDQHTHSTTPLLCNTPHTSPHQLYSEGTEDDDQSLGSPNGSLKGDESLRMGGSSKKRTKSPVGLGGSSNAHHDSREGGLGQVSYQPGKARIANFILGGGGSGGDTQAKNAVGDRISAREKEENNVSATSERASPHQKELIPGRTDAKRADDTLRNTENSESFSISADRDLNNTRSYTNRSGLQGHQGDRDTDNRAREYSSRAGNSSPMLVEYPSNYVPSASNHDENSTSSPHRARVGRDNDSISVAVGQVGSNRERKRRIDSDRSESDRKADVSDASVSDARARAESLSEQDVSDARTDAGSEKMSVEQGGEEGGGGSKDESRKDRISSSGKDHQKDSRITGRLHPDKLSTKHRGYRDTSSRDRADRARSDRDGSHIHINREGQRSHHNRSERERKDSGHHRERDHHSASHHQERRERNIKLKGDNRDRERDHDERSERTHNEDFKGKKTNDTHNSQPPYSHSHDYRHDYRNNGSHHRSSKSEHHQRSRTPRGMEEDDDEAWIDVVPASAAEWKTGAEQGHQQFSFPGSSQSDHLAAYPEESEPVREYRKQLQTVYDRNLEVWRFLCVDFHQFRLKCPDRVKALIRKGLPEFLRGSIWQKLAQSRELRKKYEPDLYDSLKAQVHAPCESDISRDVNRTFPKHVLYKDRQGMGQEQLLQVLRAYSLFNPEVGYCQGMGFIAGLLLCYLNEEDAFFMLVSLLDNYRMSGLFKPNLPLLSKYFFQLNLLIKMHLPKLHDHLVMHGVEPTMYASQWFMTVCIYGFRYSTALRVWDIFLGEGVKIIFRIALGILKLNQELLLSQGFEEILQVLKESPAQLDSESLIQTALGIKLKAAVLKDLEAAFLKDLEGTGEGKVA